MQKVLVILIAIVTYQLLTVKLGDEELDAREESLKEYKDT